MRAVSLRARRPVLVAVAHGSRDPRSAATVRALVGEVARQAPRLDVTASFLDLSSPRLVDALGAVHEAGHREAVLVPLLLGHAYHARVDVPAAVAAAGRRHPGLRVRTTDVVGGSCRLAVAALARLAEVAGPLHDPSLGVVLAGAGSSHPPANAAVAALAARWQARHGWAGAAAAFASLGPTVPEAVAALRTAGAERIAAASWFLAEGRLTDRIAAAAEASAPGCPVAAPMGADPMVARAVLHRYRQALVGAEVRRAG